MDYIKNFFIGLGIGIVFTLLIYIGADYTEVVEYLKRPEIFLLMITLVSVRTLNNIEAPVAAGGFLVGIYMINMGVGKAVIELNPISMILYMGLSYFLWQAPGSDIIPMGLSVLFTSYIIAKGLEVNIAYTIFLVVVAFTQFEKATVKENAIYLIPSMALGYFLSGMV